MAEIVNDRDLLIMAAVPRFTPPTDRGMFLTPPAAMFRASGDGSTSTPPSFTFKATLLNMAGVVSFAASNGAQLTVNAAKNEATLDFAAYAAAGAEAVYITAEITVDGVPYTQQAIVTKVSDGAQGADGAQTAVARLYQFSTTVPNKPTGNSTFTWAGAWNGAYTGTDGWGVTVPANPGTPGLRLYVASVSVSGAAKATTTPVSYTSATVEAWAQNGAKGDTGTSGVQSGAATVYQWAATIPSGPAGNALFRWASNSFGEAPSGWALAPGAAPALGMTLWAARVQLVDAATNGDTAFNWSTATIMAIGYAGTNGDPGRQGASYVTAYIASSAIAANGAPAQTTGRASLPAANSSGLAGAWSAAVPALADNQRMYQSDGIYDPATDKVTWSIPYWSSLKVATLSAITLGVMGDITAGSLNIGNGKFVVTPSGDATLSSWRLVDPNTGKTMAQAGGKFSTDFMPNEALNSQLVPSIQAAATTSTWTGTSGRPADESIRNNLVDLSSWVRLGSMPWPANGEYNVLANSLADFGVQGPKGVDDVIWYAEEKQINNNPNGDNPSGGWSDAPITLDPTKKYRFVLPIFRRAGSGWAYWGLRNVASLNGSVIVADNNPYFASSNSLTLGRWYLFVGYIFPANSVGNTNDSAGIWDCSTGEKVAGGTNYNFIPGTGTIYHRAYQYYASNGAQQLFGRPMVSLMDGAEPSLREYFAASALLNNQQQWGDVKGSNKPQDNATVGAPAGTKVGDTEAQQVVGWAYSGAVALSQVQTKIDANASNILRAPITITTGGGIVVGSLTYDATTGLRGSGAGVAITPFGIIGHNGSKYTFAISAGSGDAEFGGNLNAAYGTFGALRIAPGGFIAQGAYSGAWAWPANGAGMGFLIHPNGILLGNANDPTKGYIQLDANLGELHMPGFDYAGRQLTLDAPAIINPKLTLADRTVGIVSPSGTSFSHPRNTTSGYCGSHTASISGAVNPSYLWTAADNVWGKMIITNPTSATCSLAVVGPGGRDTGGGPIDTDFYVTCTISDGGVTKSSTINISETFT